MSWDIACPLILFFLSAPFAFGSLMATIGKIKAWKRRGLFWLGVLAVVIFQGLIFLISYLAYGRYYPNQTNNGSGLWVAYFVAGEAILLAVLSPLMFITVIILRAKNRDRFLPAYYYHLSPPLPPEPQVLQPPQAVLEPAERKVEAASELVSVPKGVTIRVKRSRTIQHTISVNWNVTGEFTGKATLIKIIELSIRTAVERSKETSFQETETMEYEVELNGSTSHSYKLVWTDVWQQGKVDVEMNIGKQCIPFEYRERSELEVISVGDELGQVSKDNEGK